MKSFKLFATLISLIAPCFVAAIGPVSAQDNTPIFTMPPIELKIVKPKALPVLLQTARPLSEQQKRLLYPQQYPVPGLYSIETVKDSKCLSILRRIKTGKDPLYLTDYNCAFHLDIDRTIVNRQNFDLAGSFLFLPQPDGGYVVKQSPYIYLDTSEVIQGTRISNNCLVVDNWQVGVIGPFSIVLDYCGDNNNRKSEGVNPTPILVSDWSIDNALLKLNNIRGNIWEFQMAVNPRTFSSEDVGDHSKDECWALRGGSAARGNDLIRWSCNGQEDQQFRLVKIADLPNDLDVIKDLNYYGWFQGPEGYLRLSPVAGVRITNLEIYDSFATDTDNGMSCAKLCLANGTCRAFTWKAAGYDDSSANYPKCELRRAGGTVSAESLPGTEMSLYSGVVRP